jgi:hypothetical protein
MKNIHIIPTDKPSRLHLWTDENGTRLELCELEYLHTRNTQNIYITSDEEIKEGDWCYDDFLKSVFQANPFMGVKTQNTSKKIILTTDQDLIKDGVQSIDDEFLEWFVKNPSCEFVEVIKDLFQVNQNNPVLKGSTALVKQHKIIIPQEEPKQDLEKEMFELEQELDIPSSMRWHNSKPKQEIKLEDIFNDEKKQGVKDLIDAHKQETLEEVAKSEAFEFSVDYKPWETDLDYREYAEYGFEKGFIEGTKHQAERMYSEEIELINWLQQSLTAKKFYSTDAEDLIEQFKKK